ncbi:MAG: SNF2-related protein [Myxococcota bacterium]
MSSRQKVPRETGQLVWCPADPGLGIGVVMGTEGTEVRVKFLRLQEERRYTTRAAEPVILRYQIGQGERVLDPQGRERRVSRCVGDDTVGLLTYELDDGEQVVESDLVPEVRDIGAKERLATLTLVHPEVVRARLQGLELLRVARRPGHAALLGARVDCLPHQFDFARRAVESDPVRILLADEVGLGKTVEAALIYAGLRQEGRAARVLILTPDALAIQWLGEIYRKTHELLVLLDEQRLEDALADFEGANPFEVHHRVIVSIDRLAREPTWAQAATQAQWDLVIVDESHHLRWRASDGGNPAYRLVEALSTRSRHLLLLTATPMALDPAEYHALLRLLDARRFDDPRNFEIIQERVATIRDVARAVQQTIDDGETLPRSAAKAARAILADDPRDVEDLDRWLKSKLPRAKRQAAAQEILDALRARHALADFVVRNRRGPVGGLPARRPRAFALTPTREQAVLVEVGEGVMLDLVRGIDDAAVRRRTLGEMMRALWATPRALSEVLRPVSADLVRELEPYIQRVTHAPLDAQGLPTGDSRLRWLVETLRAMPREQKVLVFVESAVAVRALKEALDVVLGGDIAVFHRGLSPRDQDRQVAWFRDTSGPQLMLSTEAGGEGRNFQFCHIVVLYDLPWRPATIEQRIGRVDRVGQKHDVEVLVPHFRSGFEAAILKVMQESIGVLDRTVGGIDHALEYVSDRLADLILEGAGVEPWKALYRETEQLVRQARERIEAGIDPILDHASYSPEGAERILGRVPRDLEARMELFVQRYADHSRVAVRSRGGALVAVEGAPGAAGREDESGYVGTFSRLHALDHEDVEFLSFGHPLVEQALEWAREAHDASASLALCRGFDRDGAIFTWTYELDLPADVPAAAAYFDAPTVTIALDEEGRRLERFETLLVSEERRLERMDASPLKRAIDRWRTLVETNHVAADAQARAIVEAEAKLALERFRTVMAQRRRDLERSAARELAGLPARSQAVKDAKSSALARHEELEAEAERIERAISHATARLVAAVAVRLMRAKDVSV